MQAQLAGRFKTDQGNIARLEQLLDRGDKIFTPSPARSRCGVARDGSRLHSRRADRRD
jgi:hypothetical protein